MGEKYLSVSFILIGILLGFIFFGCSSSQPKIKLNPAYNFSEKQTIATYVTPTGNDELDQTYSRVLYLDLQARGYKVINANRLLNQHLEISGETNLRQIADSLMSKKIIPLTDVYVIAKPFWDSAYVLTYYSEKSYRDYLKFSYSGMFVPTLTSQFAMYHRSIDLPMMSFTATDTIYLYSEDEDSRMVYEEYPWMVVAKQLSRELVDIPICSINNYSPAKYQYKINLWVDNSYREAFPKTWKDRLRLRVLYANDILRPQFDMELVISKFIQWDSHFQKSLDKTLMKLYEEKSSEPNTLQIGITLNKKLKKNWKSRAHIGFAILLGDDAVITAQPSFPSVGQSWNPVEESLTLAHEIGHVFGAIHVPNKNSIMYPSSGSLSFEFDSLNRQLIESTNGNFFSTDEKELLKNYSNALVNIRNTPSLNSNPILSPMAGSIIQRYVMKYSESAEPEEVYNYISTVIPDSLYSLAVIGYLQYERKNYNEAKTTFKRVLELDSEFAEVQWYLSQVYKNLGDKSLSKKYNKMAKPYKILWVLE